MVERIDDRLRVGLTAGDEAEKTTPTRIDDDAPFCIAIVADFGGPGSRSDSGESEGGRDTSAAGAGSVRALAVDRDDIDDVLARIAPALDIPIGGNGDGALRIEFRSLDDFHPDRLYERLPLFRAMSDVRDSLGSARRGSTGGGSSGNDAPRAASRSGRATGDGPVSADALLSGSSLLDQIVARGAGAEAGVADAPAAPASSDPLEAFIRRAVDASVVHEPGAADVAARDRLDAIIADAMRAILHNRAYQRIEARWRAIDFLARRIETGAKLKLFVVDAPLPTRTELEAAALEQLIRGGATGTAAGTPWAAIVLDWDVAPDPADIATLERLAASAHAAGTVLLAGADPRIAGVASAVELDDGETDGREANGRETDGRDADGREADRRDANDRWVAFRRSHASRHVGLAMPRFLLREPYGRKTDPCDAFPLEEMESDPPPHESYLWANAAFAVALVLARAFDDAGWRLEQALRPVIEGLPLHSIDDGTDLKPCAEVAMDERTARTLLDAGIMPLASVKHTDSVHLVRVQSVAEPVAGLAGGWARRG